MSHLYSPSQLSIARVRTCFSVSVGRKRGYFRLSGAESDTVRGGYLLWTLPTPVRCGLTAPQPQTF